MHRIVTILAAILLVSCHEVSTDPHDRMFNILFRYGYNGRNVLNTFENSYTNDLYAGGTITTSLVLSIDDLNAIQARLQQAEFFGYPDTFRVFIGDTLFAVQHPYQTYSFQVQVGWTTKSLYWADSIPTFYYDPRRQNLQELIGWMEKLINSKPEVRNLPPVQGGPH